MYSKIIVNNFRGFHNLQLEDLKRVNIISGKNNVGKTALLEAIFIHAGRFNPELALKVNIFRGITELAIEMSPQSEPPWASLFNGFNMSNSVDIYAYDDGNRKTSVSLKPMESKDVEDEWFNHVAKLNSTKEVDGGWSEFSAKSVKGLVLTYRAQKNSKKVEKKFNLLFTGKGPMVRPMPPSPPFPAFFQGTKSMSFFKEQTALFGKMALNKTTQEVVEFLKIVEPKLQSIQSLTVGDINMLYGDVGESHLIPISMMGDGVVRLADLILRIANCQDGVLLIDEIENGMHYSILEKIWEAIIRAAEKYNTQLFITTHSRECILAAHSAFCDSSYYDFKLLRLEAAKEEIKVFSYDEETLQTALMSNLEIR